MFRYYKILLFLTLALIYSCDSLKSISSKYNILYNGELFLNEGVNQLRESYKDDFWDVIPVIIENNITNSLPDYPSKNFLKSEQKAIKVIQKMGDDNNSASEYINDAYLLLGKSRFYDKRYISSLQAFNYILKQESKSNIWFEAFYWRTLIYINLEQFDLAKSSIEKVLNGNKLTDKNLSKIFDVLSELSYKKSDYEQLIKSLKESLKYSSDPEQKRRSHYIIAQSYDKLSKKDSAAIFFQKSIDVKANNFSEIYLDATLKLSKLKNDQIKDEYFIKMLNKPRNILSRAKINYYYALNSLAKLNYKDSEAKFNISLGLIENDLSLKLKIYEQLFDLNLNDKKYLRAGNYIDTILTNIDNNTKKYFILNKKREKLNSITDLEKQNKLIDSLLYLSTLDSYELNKTLNVSSKNNSINKELVEKTSNPNSLGVFYFNNRIAIENGKKQFNRLWGERSRIDNWRFKLGNNSVIEKNVDKITQPEQVTLGPTLFNIKNIPYKNSQKDSLTKIKNSNHFKKGIYLYEYFNDLHNSEKSLLKVNPKLVSENDFIQTNYYLYKIYTSQELEDKEKAIDLKNLIIQNYPNSVYAKIVSNNPDINIDFNTKEYLEGINPKERNIDKIVRSIDSILPTVSSRLDLYTLYQKKYEIQAKSVGLVKYLESLNNLIELFPEKKAELTERIDFLKTLLAKNSLSISDDSFTIFFVVTKNEETKLHANVQFKIDNYDSNIDLIKFDGYVSEDEAKLSLEEIIKKYKTLSNNKYFVISTPQYINMLVFKTLDELKS